MIFFKILAVMSFLGCCGTFLGTLVVMRQHGAGWIIGAFFFPVTIHILYYFCHEPDLSEAEKESFSNFGVACFWFALSLSGFFYFAS